MTMDISLPEVQFSGDHGRNSISDPVIFQEKASEILSRSGNALEEHDIHTCLRIPIKVFVSRSEKTTPIVTFHDIGTNHNSLLGFFNYREMKVILKHFTVYHICAPGHHENASAVDLKMKDEEKHGLLNENGQFPMTERRSSTHSRDLPTMSANAVYPNLDQLAMMVDSVIKHFDLKNFIGFGVGAGSNILCRYTLKNQDKVRALFLVNPDAGVHGYYEWFRLRWFDIPNMKRGGSVTDNILNFLEAHWFGYNENQEVNQYYEQMVRDLNPVNVAGFVDAWLSRTDLGLVRTLGPDSVKEQDADHCIRTDVCLVTGALSTDLAKNLANMNGRMDPAKTQFLILEDCNGMLIEERPDKLAINFLYFLRTVGLLINLQPDALLRQAEELQTLEFEASHNISPQKQRLVEISTVDQEETSLL